jgi:hypothetical protein
MGNLFPPNKSISCAVCFAIAMLFVFPVPAPAKEPRGAKIVVTCVDGKQYEGELLAVKEDSLLLLGSGDRGESIDLAGIVSVRIKRKSRAGTLAIGGLLAGGLGGAILGSQAGDDVFDNPSLAIGAIFGGLGALAGLALSIPVGMDSTFAVSGEPDATVERRLKKLSRLSRESRIARTQRYPRPGKGEL